MLVFFLRIEGALFVVVEGPLKAIVSELAGHINGT
jgi:hypothetical protein